jgi:hypothetical protein
MGGSLKACPERSRRAAGFGDGRNDSANRPVLVSQSDMMSLGWPLQNPGFD